MSGVGDAGDDLRWAARDQLELVIDIGEARIGVKCDAGEQLLASVERASEQLLVVLATPEIAGGVVSAHDEDLAVADTVDGELDGRARLG
jgi:hypothetical protein